MREVFRKAKGVVMCMTKKCNSKEQNIGTQNYTDDDIKKRQRKQKYRTGAINHDE